MSANTYFYKPTILSLNDCIKGVKEILYNNYKILTELNYHSEAEWNKRIIHYIEIGFIKNACFKLLSEISSNYIFKNNMLYECDKNLTNLFRPFNYHYIQLNNFDELMTFLNTKYICYMTNTKENVIDIIRVFFKDNRNFIEII